MLHVNLREGESFDTLLSRFRASVAKSGVLQELKERRFFISKAEKARMAARRSARRHRRRAQGD